MIVDESSSTLNKSNISSDSTSDHQDSNSIEQTVQQSNSEFSTNAGIIRNAHIGHNYNYHNDPETIRRIVQEELKSPQLDYLQLVREGLITLVEAVAIPEIRDAVIAFNTDFRAACDYIYLLASYKDLHDLLHRLEFECYKSIILEQHRFPDDEITLETLVEHGLTLKSLIDQLVAIANQEVLVTQEILWVKELEQACSAFHVAVQKRNTQCFNQSIRLLTRVLLLQPSRINTYLNAAAQGLRLPYLIIAMRNILQTLRSSKLSVQQITQFQQGLEALEKLQDRLLALVVTHDSWQVIDIELRQLEISLNHSMDDLTTSWSYLNTRVRSLCSGETDSWSVSIQEYGERLEQALIPSIQNSSDVKQYFRFYRKGASERFYQTDKALKRLCDELRTIGEPLASVLRAIT